MVENNEAGIRNIKNEMYTLDLVGNHKECIHLLNLTYNIMYHVFKNHRKLLIENLVYFCQKILAHFDLVLHKYSSLPDLVFIYL